LRKLVNESKGTQQVDALNELSRTLSSYDYEQSTKEAERAYALAKELKYTEGMSMAALCKGLVNVAVPRSRNYFRESIRLSNDKTQKGYALTYLGFSYQTIGQVDSADLFFKQAYQALRDSANPYYLSLLYLSMGVLEGTKSNISLQLQYYTKSYAIRKNLNDKPAAFVHVGRYLSGYYTEHGDYKKSLSILDEVQKVLKQDTISNQEISLLRKERAIVYAHLGNFRASLELFTKVKNFYTQNPSPLELVRLLTDEGEALTYSTNFETSLKYFFQALELAEENQFKKNIAYIYYRITGTYVAMHQNPLAEEYARKYLDMAIKNHFEFEEAGAYNQLGILFTRENKFKEALDYFDKSLALRKKLHLPLYVASVLKNTSDVYVLLKDYKRAEEYAQQSANIRNEVNSVFEIGESYAVLGKIYILEKEYAKAQNNLAQAEALEKKIKAPDLLIEIYKGKRDLLQATGKFKEALDYSLRYETLKDSLYNRNVTNRAMTMQFDFELDQKAREIEALNQKQLLQQNQLEQQRNEIRRRGLFILTAIIFSVAVGVFAYFIYVSYKRIRKLNFEVTEQNEEITAQTEELREANEALSNLNRELSDQKNLIEEQTEELTISSQIIERVNDELEEKVKQRTNELKAAHHELDIFFYRSSHDFRRPLTTFMGLAEVAKLIVKENQALELFDKVNDTARMLDKMLAKLQSVSLSSSDELIASTVYFKTIFETEINNFQSELLSKKIDVVFQVDVTHEVYTYVALVRIVIQNLIENAIAFCTNYNPKIELRAIEKNNEVELTVADNGQGINSVFIPRICEMYFRANEKSTGNGLGLYIVKKMVSRMQGRMDIKSEMGKGTEVKIFLPFVVKQ